MANTHRPRRLQSTAGKPPAPDIGVGMSGKRVDHDRFALRFGRYRGSRGTGSFDPFRKNLMIVIRKSVDMNNEVRWIEFQPVVTGAQIAALVDQVSDDTMHLVSIFPQREL